MARKKGSKEEPKQWEKAKWKGFVNIRLKSQEKEAIKKRLLDETESLQVLVDMATDGYKLSLSYSIPEDVYTVSATGQYQDMTNAGMTMTLRHKEYVKAISALAWCHEEAGKNGGWEERFTSGNDDDW